MNEPLFRHAAKPFHLATVSRPAPTRQRRPATTLRQVADAHDAVAATLLPVACDRSLVLGPPCRRAVIHRRLTRWPRGQPTALRPTSAAPH